MSHPLFEIRRKVFVLNSSYFLVFILTGGLLVLSACGSSQTIATDIRLAATATNLASNVPTTQAAISQDWQYRWLKGIPCSLPCWEGITPGKTGAVEALKLLKQNPMVTAAEIKQPGLDPNYGWVIWDWVNGFPNINNKNRAGQGGEIFFKSKSPDQVVYLIRPAYPSYKLKEIIQAFGEPTHIITTVIPKPPSYDFFYYVHIVYLTRGLVLSLEGPSKPVLSDELESDKILFFVSNLDGLNGTGISNKILVRWQGFKDFDFYCQVDYARGVRPCSSAELKSKS